MFTTPRRFTKCAVLPIHPDVLVDVTPPDGIVGGGIVGEYGALAVLALSAPESGEVGAHLGGVTAATAVTQKQMVSEIARC